jgi:hypothetical protein
MTLFRFYWQQLVTMEVVRLCYSEISPVWRNWQTQQTQNLPGITPREGSIPFTGTKNCFVPYVRITKGRLARETRRS